MNKANQLNFSIFQWIFVCIRALCLAWALGFNYLFQNFLPILGSCIPFLIWKRYISCMINLIMNRIVFLILGFFRFECQNFGFFSKDTQKISVKSGFIAMGTHKNIVDFFYYSYMFNPLFVRIILIVQKQIKGGNQYQTIKQVNYSPLSYSQALQCAFQNKGFDPIIVRDQKQLKSLKYRKMNMKTLVSESFEQLKGCIFILLPGLKVNEHIQIQQKIADDVFDNQLKFLRSGVGLKVQFQQRPIFQKSFKNQMYLLLNLMSQRKINHLSVTGLSFRKDFKYQYHKQTYRKFIEDNFFLNTPGIKYKQITYLEYMEQIEADQSKSDKKQKTSSIKNE